MICKHCGEEYIESVYNNTGACSECGSIINPKFIKPKTVYRKTSSNTMNSKKNKEEAFLGKIKTEKNEEEKNKIPPLKIPETKTEQTKPYSAKEQNTVKVIDRQNGNRENKDVKQENYSPLPLQKNHNKESDTASKEVEILNSNISDTICEEYEFEEVSVSTMISRNNNKVLDEEPQEQSFLYGCEVVREELFEATNEVQCDVNEFTQEIEDVKTDAFGKGSTVDLKEKTVEPKEETKEDAPKTLKGVTKSCAEWLKEKKEINEDKRKEEKEPNVDYDFNHDGFYDDTPSYEEALPDVLSKNLLFKILGATLGLFLIIIFLIYYA